MAICFRLFIQSGALAESSLDSPGMNEVCWLTPVRPGDTLHSVIEVVEILPSTAEPDRGFARMKYGAINQRGDTVLSFIISHILRRRIDV